MSDQESLSWLQSDQIYVGRRKSGVNVTELLDLPETQRRLMVEIARREPVSLKALVESLNRDPVELEVQISQMVAQGWLDVEENEAGEWLYRVRIARSGKRVLPPGIWQVLDNQWQVPIFRLFSEAVLEQFSDSFQLRHYQAGAMLFQVGEWGEQMYIVEQGKVDLLVYNEAGKPFVVREVVPGGVFGEMSVLLGERRPYAAHVLEDAQIWTLARSDVDALLSQHPAAGLVLRQELARHLKPVSRIAEAKTQYNPIVTVGEGSGDLARHLAEQNQDQVVLIDLSGQAQSQVPRLTVIDGSGLHSKALAQLIQEKMEQAAWVVIAALPKMTDQLMRVTGVTEVVIDMTGSGAPWLRAAARRYWVMPSSTPLQLARLARRLSGRVTGLVFSGGAARSIAHLGVLDVLHRAGVPVDLCASCGFGALWSVLYAAGWSPQQMIDLVQDKGVRLNPFGGHIGLHATARAGVFDAHAARRLIQQLVGDTRFSELSTPCYLATSDLDTGKVVWLSEGPVFNALAACVATPGLVTPIDYQEYSLVDGILSNPLPVDAAKTHGADLIVASSVIPMPSDRGAASKGRKRNLVNSWLGLADVVAHERSLDHLRSVDILVAPDVSAFSDADFGAARQLIDRGRDAAAAVLPRIRALLQEEA